MDTDQMTHPPTDPPADPSAPPDERPDLVDRLASLRRDSSHRWLGGVAGGVARGLDVDPVLVRAVLAVLGVFGVGIVLYVALWLVMPDDRSDSAVIGLRRRTVGGAIAAAGIVAVAWLAGLALGLQAEPLVLIGIVVAAVLWFRERRLDDDTVARRHGGVRASAATSQDPRAAQVAPDPADRLPAAAERRVERRALRRVRRRAAGPLLLWPVLATASLVLGLMALGATTGLVGVAPSAYVAAFLLIVAIGLLVGSRRGRPRGLGVLGLLTTLLLIPTTVGDDASERLVAPTTAAQVPVSETFGTGHLQLDLTGLAPEDLEGRATTVRGDLGIVEVTVPDGTPVVLRGQIDGFGGMELFGGGAEGPRGTELIKGGVAGSSEFMLYGADDPLPPGAYVLDVSLDHGVVDVKAAGR